MSASPKENPQSLNCKLKAKNEREAVSKMKERKRRKDTKVGCNIPCATKPREQSEPESGIPEHREERREALHEKHLFLFLDLLADRLLNYPETVPKETRQIKVFTG